MTKWIRSLFIGITAVLLLIPVATIPLWGETTSAEKRQLAEFPSLTTAEGALNTDFFTGLEDYLADHFSFRSSLVTAQSLLKAKLFGVSAEDTVIVGSDNWLYFSKTLEDYTGSAVISDLTAAHIAAEMALIEEYVNASGGQLVVTVVPNKNTIYPSYMPYYVLQTTQETSLDKLTAVLQSDDSFVDMRACLLAEADTSQLYHKRDSHWNNLGARLGYEALMAATGRPYTSYADTPYTLQTIWEGDLDALLFPSLGILDEQAVLETNWTYSYTSHYRSEEDITITTACPSGSGTLLMFRDSFANALLPFLAEQYEEATFSRATPMDLTLVPNADTVMIEIVERNLSNLAKTAPQMPALTRTPASPWVETNALLTASVETSENYRLVYGLYDEALAAEATHLYLSVEGGDTYEAFPIAESTRLGLDGVADNGFSAYLPIDDVPAGATVTVLLQTDTQLLAIGSITIES